MKTTLQELAQELAALEASLIEVTHEFDVYLDQIPVDQRVAATNLIKYLYFRSKDRKSLQEKLHFYGFSALSNSENHLHRQVQTIRQRLGHTYAEGELNPCTYKFSRKRLEQNSKLLFGKQAQAKMPTVMVTFATDFADNPELIERLLLNGMQVARINCAHDDQEVWQKMIDQVRAAEEKTGLSCKIYFDLAGPKIRTSLLAKGKEEGKVKVEEGDEIWLAESKQDFSAEDIVISPNEKGIIPSLQEGHRVFIDDGEISGVVTRAMKGKAAVKLERVAAKKGKIKSEKGINFPDSPLSIPSLTDYDKDCLPFITAHADLLGYSFVKTPGDITKLNNELKKLKLKKQPAIILKIETPESVKNLPALLFEAMKTPPFGIMIARGDLAVEIGFGRMGEIQDQISWICEAAHVPVVWATQVLEKLQKSGMPTRSEITDAVQASLAECIMINKGNHTIRVLKTLKEIMQRTAGHRTKKRFIFRPLSIAIDFIESKNIYNILPKAEEK
ncbi:pyruvate kinase [Cyclobacterium sp. 1_MG-2023]|uniref:pyruvate kinase n=1 Tax=Cyclobacterium sp. 1_MG-2023 TaxID=3062681 RepID=UPI0026E47A98|nr:pyruvate kinase [Cyclobacterium sp. 1_MG-2023]MDO6437256.1 pyruvate kinase [Cyclobacterium sp. 1_MG-2023]